MRTTVGLEAQVLGSDSIEMVEVGRFEEQAEDRAFPCLSTWLCGKQSLSLCSAQDLRLHGFPRALVCAVVSGRTVAVCNDVLERIPVTREAADLYSQLCHLVAQYSLDVPEPPLPEEDKEEEANRAGVAEDPLCGRTNEHPGVRPVSLFLEALSPSMPQAILPNRTLSLLTSHLVCPCPSVISTVAIQGAVETASRLLLWVYYIHPMDLSVSVWEFVRGYTCICLSIYDS